MSVISRLLTFVWVWLILMVVFVFVNIQTNNQFLIEWVFVFGGFAATAIAIIVMKDEV